MANGFKVWHYSGALLHDTAWPEGQELLAVTWQKYNEGVCQEKPISSAKVQGIQSSQPQASKAKYIPPYARPGGDTMAYSPRSAAMEARGPIPGIPINYKMSQGQMKKQRNGRKSHDGTINGSPNTHQGSFGDGEQRNANNKLRNPRQRRSEPPANHAQTTTPRPDGGEVDANADQQQQQPARPRRPRNRNNSNNASANHTATTGDPEKDKRIKVLQKKIKEIASLKSRQDQGLHLEANQLSKINSEQQLTQELNALKIKA